MNETEINLRAAELFARLFLGILFIAQGYDKLFVLKIKQVIDTFLEESRRKHIPYFFVAFSAYFTAITEFFGGLFLVFGLFHYAVYILLMINLLMVAIGFSVLKPIWDLQHVFPRVILLIIIILLSPFFYYGLDAIIFR